MFFYQSFLLLCNKENLCYTVKIYYKKLHPIKINFTNLFYLDF